MQAGEQDKAGDVDQHEHDRRSGAADQIAEKKIADPFAHPATGAGDIEPFHIEQAGKALREARPGGDEGHGPPGAGRETLVGVEQFHAPVTQEQGGHQVGSRAQEGIDAARDDGAAPADEIEHRAPRGRHAAEREPAGHIGRGVRNKREEQQRAETEQDEAEHFVQRVGVVFLGASH